MAKDRSNVAAGMKLMPGHRRRQTAAVRTGLVTGVRRSIGGGRAGESEPAGPVFLPFVLSKRENHKAGIQADSLVLDWIDQGRDLAGEVVGSRGPRLRRKRCNVSSKCIGETKSLQILIVFFWTIFQIYTSTDCFERFE
jgi:hypothetical protein